MVERRGNTFHLRTSPDGQDWVEMPGSPLVCKDLDGKAVQAGPFHCMYSDAEGSVAYDYFRISQPRAAQP